MGLDLIVESASRPGHEAEWRRLIGRALAEEDLSDTEVARFQEISTPAYEALGAPRVGFDEVANAWIFDAQDAKTSEERAAVLEKFHGHYALPLVKSDGLPKVSHGGLYEGVDETSFRGSALELCGDVLSKAMIDGAYEHRLPEAAVAYGRALLAAANAASPPDPAPPPKKGLLTRLGLGRPPRPAEPFEKQLEIVREAGRWFVFWGERGHAIRAWV